MSLQAWKEQLDREADEDSLKEKAPDPGLASQLKSLMGGKAQNADRGGGDSAGSSVSIRPQKFPNMVGIHDDVSTILSNPTAYESFLRKLNGPTALPNQRIFIADLLVDEKGKRVAQYLSGKRSGEVTEEFSDPVIVRCRPDYDERSGRYSLKPVDPDRKGEEDLSAELGGQTVLAELRSRQGDARARLFIARIERLPKGMVDEYVALANKENTELPEPSSPIALTITNLESDIADALNSLVSNRTPAKKEAYKNIVAHLNGNVTGEERILPAYIRLSDGIIGLEAVLDGDDFGQADRREGVPFVRGTLKKRSAEEGGLSMTIEPSKRIGVSESDDGRLVLAKFWSPQNDGTVPIGIARLDQLSEKYRSYIYQTVEEALSSEAPPLTRIPSNQPLQHQKSGNGSDGAKAEEPEPSKV